MNILYPRFVVFVWWVKLLQTRRPVRQIFIFFLPKLTWLVLRVTAVFISHQLMRFLFRTWAEMHWQQWISWVTMCMRHTGRHSLALVVIMFKKNGPISTVFTPWKECGKNHILHYEGFWCRGSRCEFRQMSNSKSPSMILSIRDYLRIWLFHRRRQGVGGCEVPPLKKNLWNLPWNSAHQNFF
jgi:hypothetical protein